MNINETYTSNSTFLKPADLGTAKPVVTIDSVTLSEKDFNDGKGLRKQLVPHFVGKEKALGLNKVNAEKIAELVGSPETDDWIGKSIKLFTEMVQVGTEKKLAIRVFPELPPQPAPMTGTPPADENGDIPW